MTTPLTPLTLSCKIVFGLTSGIGIVMGSTLISYITGSRPATILVGAVSVLATGTVFIISEPVCRDLSSEKIGSSLQHVPRDIEAYSNDPAIVRQSIQIP